MMAMVETVPTTSGAIFKRRNFILSDGVHRIHFHYNHPQVGFGTLVALRPTHTARDLATRYDYSFFKNRGFSPGTPVSSHREC